MRKFNKREKEFLILLEEISNNDLEFFSFFLQNKYFTESKNSALFILPKQNTAILYIRKKIFDNLKLRKEELRDFIEILSLIENLKDDRFINIIPNPEVLNTSMHIMHKSFTKPNQSSKDSSISLNKEGMHLKYPDISKIYNSKDKVEFEGVKLEEHTYNLIITNFMGLLFISQELKDFVKNDFRSLEDIRYKNSQKATWFGLILALTFGVFGIYNSFSSNEKLNSDKQEKQLNHIFEINSKIHYEILNKKIIVEKIIESDSSNKQ
jgi:hypothetical protein